MFKHNLSFILALLFAFLISSIVGCAGPIGGLVKPKTKLTFYKGLLGAGGSWENDKEFSGSVGEVSVNPESGTLMIKDMQVDNSAVAVITANVEQMRVLGEVYTAFFDGLSKWKGTQGGLERIAEILVTPFLGLSIGGGSVLETGGGTAPGDTGSAGANGRAAANTTREDQAGS